MGVQASKPPRASVASQASFPVPKNKQNTEQPVIMVHGTPSRAASARNFGSASMGDTSVGGRSRMGTPLERTSSAPSPGAMRRGGGRSVSQPRSYAGTPQQRGGSLPPTPQAMVTPRQGGVPQRAGVAQRAVGPGGIPLAPNAVQQPAQVVRAASQPQLRTAAAGGQRPPVYYGPNGRPYVVQQPPPQPAAQQPPAPEPTPDMVSTEAAEMAARDALQSREQAAWFEILDDAESSHAAARFRSSLQEMGTPTRSDGGGDGSAGEANDRPGSVVTTSVVSGVAPSSAAGATRSPPPPPPDVEPVDARDDDVDNGRTRRSRAFTALVAANQQTTRGRALTSTLRTSAYTGVSDVRSASQPEQTAASQRGGGSAKAATGGSSLPRSENDDIRSAFGESRASSREAQAGPGRVAAESPAAPQTVSAPAKDGAWDIDPSGAPYRRRADTTRRAPPPAPERFGAGVSTDPEPVVDTQRPSAAGAPRSSSGRRRAFSTPHALPDVDVSLDMDDRRVRQRRLVEASQSMYTTSRGGPGRAAPGIPLEAELSPGRGGSRRRPAPEEPVAGEAYGSSRGLSPRRTPPAAPAAALAAPPATHGGRRAPPQVPQSPPGVSSPPPSNSPFNMPSSVKSGATDSVFSGRAALSSSRADAAATTRRSVTMADSSSASRFTRTS